MLTNEETQALFNFPDHIKFKFDWEGPGFDAIQLEEDLFVKFSKKEDPRYYNFRFYNNKAKDHNPYGPSNVYKDGSTFYRISNKFHRLDGPAWVNYSPTGKAEMSFSIEGVEYNYSLIGLQSKSTNKSTVFHDYLIPQNSIFRTPKLLLTGNL